MKQPTPRVFVVDDDPLARTARSLEFSGLSVQIFASACDFLEQIPVDVTGCVVLDLALPDVQWTSGAGSVDHARQPNARHISCWARRCSDQCDGHEERRG